MRILRKEVDNIYDTFQQSDGLIDDFNADYYLDIAEDKIRFDQFDINLVEDEEEVYFFIKKKSDNSFTIKYYNVYTDEIIETSEISFDSVLSYFDTWLSSIKEEILTLNKFDKHDEEYYNEEEPMSIEEVKHEKNKLNEIENFLKEIIRKQDIHSDGQEIIFEELEKVKEMLKTQSKTNYKKFFMGSMVQLGLDRVISKETLQAIMNIFSDNDVTKLLE